GVGPCPAQPFYTREGRVANGRATFGAGRVRSGHSGGPLRDTRGGRSPEPRDLPGHGALADAEKLGDPATCDPMLDESREALALAIVERVAAAELDPAAAGRLEPGAGALDDERPLVLGEGPADLQKEAPGRGARVDPVVERHEIDAEGFQLAEHREQVREAAAEPVELHDDHGVDLAAPGL